MTRPADLTRGALIEAATAIFAAKGYEGGSVRQITEKAKANQAAINYHFGSKDGLYREVLRNALHAFDEFSVIDEDALPGMDREEAVRRYLGQQLVPLLRRNQLSQYLRIFNWEILQPTSMFQELVASERLPAVAAAIGILGKFLPDDATQEERTIAMIWLVNQAYIFVRNYDHLSRAPLNLKVDEAFLERLIDLLSRLIIGGLVGFSRATDSHAAARRSRPAVA
jgi:AcrR family transcriptional regulator